MQIQCEDGSQLEVVPKVLNERADLVPLDPREISTASCPATNAEVCLRRPEGTIVRSVGSGDVNIVSGLRVAALGEKEALQSNENGAYVAHLNGDSITVKDQEGNTFEVRGDQTVDATLAVSMGNAITSPRAKKAGTPYLHPDASFLKVPDDAPEPRLFAVYGDGEAEELLPEARVREALRLSKLDRNAVVIEAEAMGYPMEPCLCHTILRTASMDPPLGASGTAPRLPPVLAGFQDAFANGPQGLSRTFTEFRQFIEYPAITVERRQDFQIALARFLAREEEHHREHAEYGEGLRKGIFPGLGAMAQ